MGTVNCGKDRLVFALDLPSANEAEEYARLLRGRVGMFKIGLELFVEAGPDIVRRVRELGKAGIFLDLKFHDISRTVERSMARVADLGVDLMTVHCASSLEMLKMAVKGSGGRTGVLGVTVLTDNDPATIEAGGFKMAYVADLQALVMKRAAMACEAGCRGVVCSGHEAAGIKKRFGKDFLTVTPGIRPEWSVTEGDDQKRVTTPAMAIEAGADLLVVGRPIKTATDPAVAADRIAEEIERALRIGLK